MLEPQRRKYVRASAVSPLVEAGNAILSAPARPLARAFLGLQLRPMPPDVAQQLEVAVPEGAIVTQRHPITVTPSR